MFAAISGFIGLIIFIAVAILSSLLKRKEEGEFELPPELKPGRDKPPRPPQPTARNWEEQLRQLLEERPAPPPIVQGLPAPPPPVRPVFRPAPVAELEPHIEVSLPAPHPKVAPTFQRLAGLTQSGARYADAANLQHRVTQHLADVTRQRVGTTSVTRAATAPRVREAVSAMREAEGVRRAILASIILGEPRAFDL
jgi:hypothetical protein